MIINGEYVESVSGERTNIINPATGEVIDSVPTGIVEDVKSAVDHSSKAQEQWSETGTRERSRLFFSIADEVRQKTDELSLLLTTEQGKPLPESKNEILGFANVFEYYAGLSSALRGEYIDLPGYGSAFTNYEPVGICGAIIPWNMPAIIMSWKVAPALLAGNSIILKPATTTPLTAIMLTKIIHKAGLPAGVLNVVTGPGGTTGEEIIKNSLIRKVSFTGSVKTGRRVAFLAGQSIKKLTLELGGSDPMIVCHDADLENAAAAAVMYRFYNCGQVCSAVKRLYVEKSIYSRFMELLIEKTKAIKVGNGLEKDTAMGPLNNKEQRDEVLRQINDSSDSKEFSIITGGSVPKDRHLENGYFLEPTVISGTDIDSPLLSEEVFGPVLPVMSVENLESAVIEANRTKYGLGASVWTKDIGNAGKAAREIKAGMIWINQHLAAPPEVPFGGVKSSGIGRENGVRALLEFLDEKTLIIRE